MRIINRVTGETIGNICTNHSMTLDEAIELVGTLHSYEDGTDRPDVEIGDEWYYYEDLDFVDDEEING